MNYINQCGVAVAVMLSLFASGEASADNLRFAAPMERMERIAPVVRSAPLPDITSRRGIKIGGKFAPWGGRIHLTKKNAIRPVYNGRCAFDVIYNQRNIGAAATHPAFVNRLRSGSTVVSQQTALHLKAGEVQTIHTQAYLRPGDQVVSLSLDEGRQVHESNEGNNRFRVVVDVTCTGRAHAGLGKPDLVPVLSHPMNGAVAVRNIGAVASAPSKLGLKCAKVGHTGGGGGCPDAPGLGTYKDPRFPGELILNVPAVRPGGKYVHHFGFWPTLRFAPGQYRFTATADIGRTVAESNEANNITTSVLFQRVHNRVALADITSRGGITINGKYAPWGNTLTLTTAEATSSANGYCTFSNVYYDISNLGYASTGPFSDRLHSGRSGTVIVGTQTGLALRAGEKRRIRSQELHLFPGQNVISLSLDNGNTVKESNERNNRFRVVVDVRGACSGAVAAPQLLPLIRPLRQR